MRVGLIIPPSLILSDERFFMHIGILKVAAVLEKAGYGVDVLDLSAVSNYCEAVETYVSTTNLDAIGITATSPQMPATKRIIEVIRKIKPKLRIILGGTHVTLTHAAHRKEAGRGGINRAGEALHVLRRLADGVVGGAGEEAIFTALAEKPPMIVDADNPRESLFLSPQKLTELPFPARHLVDVSSYHYQIDGVRALSMIAQLGCPFQCGFCGGRESPFLRRVRLRTTENVVAELRHIYEQYEIRGIMFYDDELNVNKEIVPLMRAIRDLGKELGVEWVLRGFVKAELFTENQAKAMREAGFKEILTGFESGSPRILRNICKGATREDNTRCVEIARRNGLRVKALMSVGHPGESAKTINETKNWILAMQPESFDLTRITVYPGTPYYDRAVPDKKRDGVWRYEIFGDALYSADVDCTVDFLYYKGDRGDRAGLNKFFASTDFLSADDLMYLRDETERELREALQQPYQVDAPVLQFEHSMGQGLPDFILRSTTKQ